MKYLIEQFMLGFGEGWKTFWSPIAAITQSFKSTWVSHVTSHPKAR